MLEFVTSRLWIFLDIVGNQMLEQRVLSELMRIVTDPQKCFKPF